MKAQRNVPATSGGPKLREVKLLLVGRDDEFEDNVSRRLFDATHPWIANRSATLLGALECLQSKGVDVVLLGHDFRDEELELFVADARRNGFEGLILRVAVMKGFRNDSSGNSPSAALTPTRGPLDDSMHPARIALGVRRQNEGWNRSLSFTSRQRAVLARVAEGWTNQQIATQLQCTEGAVKAILQELFRKLEVRKRSQIVRVAFEKGLIDTAGKAVGPFYQAKETDPALSFGTEALDEKPIQVGDFIIDVGMHRVWVCGVETHLTPSEFQLLWVFAMNSGKLVTGSRLREMFWRNPTSRQSDLRVLVGTLRAKIEVSKTPRYVVTERYLGYRFIPSPSLSQADRSVP